MALVATASASHSRWILAVLLTECADHDVVTIWIPERKLFCPCRGVHMRLLVESGYKSEGSLQCEVEVIDAEEQE
jgi:hypothetical protein